jgi:hypothetical protein
MDTTAAPKEEVSTNTEDYADNQGRQITGVVDEPETNIRPTILLS